MRTIAKFPTAAEAQEALELLKARGIPGAVFPDEVQDLTWLVRFDRLARPVEIGFRLDVEDDRSDEAWGALKDLGFNVIED
jgi:hypothetical protein